jgi:hypothetical protein
MPAYPNHQDIRPAYVQTTDPGAVGAGVFWVDTSSFVLKVRNSGDTGWNDIKSGAGQQTPLVSDGEDGEDGLEWHPPTKTTDFIHLQFSSAISIAFDTVTLVTWNTVVSNIGALTQTDTNTKVLISKTGIYAVTYTGQWDDAASGVQLNQLVTTNLGTLGVNRVKGLYSNYPSWFITLVVKLTAGDKVWGNAYTGVATGLSVLGTDTAANGLIIKLLELIP